MSLPLLLARKQSGFGPRVPVKDAYTHLVVEGMTLGSKVKVHTGTFEISARENGTFPLPRPTEKGFSAQAELVGDGYVHVTLEKLNGRHDAPELPG